VNFSAYLEFAKRAFAREGTYRTEVFTSIGSIVLRVYLLMVVWTALYRDNGMQRGVPLHATLTYLTLALLIGLIYNVNGAYLVRERIREGEIAIDFMRPISIPLYVFSDTLGQSAFAFFEIVPALALSLFIVHIDPAASPLALVGFAASLAFGFIINFFLDMIMATITFWTMEIYGIQLMAQFITTLLSGALVPLYFFPGIWEKIVVALPFAAIYNAPLSIYIGRVQGPDILRTIAGQAVWALLFMAFSTVLWRIGERRVVIQGG